MVLSDVSIKRPVFATVLSLLIVVFGLAALMGLPVREIVSASHVLTDLTLAPITTVHDYLEES